MPDSISGAALLPTFKSNADLNRAIAESGLGINGSHFVNDTTTHAPAPRSFSIISFVTATVVDRIDGNIDGNAIAGVTFPAGYILYGNFTSVKLTSGSCICYYKQQFMS